LLNGLPAAPQRRASAVLFIFRRHINRQLTCREAACGLRQELAGLGR
jgi:hypothetical protein